MTVEIVAFREMNRDGLVGFATVRLYSGTRYQGNTCPKGHESKGAGASSCTRKRSLSTAGNATPAEMPHSRLPSGKLMFSFRRVDEWLEFFEVHGSSSQHEINALPNFDRRVVSAFTKLTEGR